MQRTLGVYGTFIHQNSFFTDLVLKYRWIDNDFNVLDSGGGRLPGAGTADTFTKEKISGWYIEPQVQLSYMCQDEGDITLSNGLRVGAES